MIVYVLKLQQGKYYVGKTNKSSVQERFEEHQCGRGSAWTRKYSPMSIVSEERTTNRRQEYNETLNCMEKYGIDNVRGSVYSQVTLSNEDEDTIIKILRHDNDQCLRCGRDGHFANRCNATTHSDGSLFVDDSSDDNDDVNSDDDSNDDYNNNIANNGNNHIIEHQQQQQQPNYGRCHRCGRTSHFVKDCFALSYVDGSAIISDNNGRYRHRNDIDGDNDDGDGENEQDQEDGDLEEDDSESEVDQDQDQEDSDDSDDEDEYD